MDTKSSLLNMSYEMQISNVGSEIHRAIRWRDKGDEDGKAEFCKVAIQFLKIIKEDPKNKQREKELDFRIAELEDYFLGENKYNTSDDKLIEFYDGFLDGLYS